MGKPILITTTALATALAVWTWRRSKGKAGRKARETIQSVNKEEEEEKRLRQEKWQQLVALRDPTLNQVQTTSLNGAGMRVAEMRHVKNPVITNDELAAVLAGAYGVKLGEFALEASMKAQPGEDRHYYWAVRARIIDDRLVAAIEELSAADPTRPVQVVSLGTGMCTRPWRLKFPAATDCRWFDVDQPPVIDYKVRKLEEGRAQWKAPQATPPPSSSSQPQDAADAASKDTPSSDVAEDAEAFAFPLKCTAYTPVRVNHETDALTDVLISAGLDPTGPTVFVAEGLSYYLQIPALQHLLQDAGALCTKNSQLLITVCSEEYLRAVQAMNNDTFKFYNCVTNFTADDCAMLREAGWDLVNVSKDFADVLKEEYGMESYWAGTANGSLKDVDTEYVLTAKRR